MFTIKIILIWITISCPTVLWSQSILIEVLASESGLPMYQSHALNLSTGNGGVADQKGRINLIGHVGDSISVGYVGYMDTTFIIQEGITSYTISLRVQSMEEVVIFAEEPFNQRAANGRQDVSMEFLEALPAFNGDPDIIKSMTFLPGVTGGKDGYAHMFVRGGDQDENLILLDGAPMYNVNHFAGLVSMFHSAMIGSVDMYKGYWPSRFGGRLSSVMDIRTQSGNYKENTFTADISPISTKAHISGPLWKDKISYIIGGRRTFVDLLFLRKRINRLRSGERIGNSPMFTFYDINGKIEARIGDNQYISFSTFRGADRLFYYENEISRADNEYNIRNQNYALNYSWYLDETSTIRAHISSSYYHHFFNDLEYRPIADNIDNQKTWHVNYRYTGNTIRTHKATVSGNKNWKDRGNLEYGLDHETIRYSLYLNRSEGIEKGDIYSHLDSVSLQRNQQQILVTSLYADAEFNIIDRLRVKGGIRIPRYRSDIFEKWMYEPKALVSFDLSPGATINLTYNRQSQHTHLLSYTESTGYFREFYMTSDMVTPPSTAHQWSLGWFYHYNKNNTWLSEANISLEAFYKQRNNLNKFIPGADPDASVVEYTDHLLKHGKGYSYGLEFLFQKTIGKFHGSLSYTLAENKIQFKEINHGLSFPGDFDYRHKLHFLLIYKFRNGYQLSGQWEYRSGRPFTLINTLATGDDIITGQYPIINQINNSRLPAYHRLDVSLDREWRTKKRGHKQWFGISIYNAYNHINPFYAYPENGKLTVKGFIPIFPSFHFGLEL